MQATSTFPFHFHFYTYCLDADGLKYIIVSHSQYNLVTNDMQSKDNYFIPVDQPITDIPSDVINLFICGYDQLFDQSIFLHSFSKLQTIVIGSNCFNHVREFVIDGLASLESVKIGEYSLGMDGEERDDGVCRITNCPNLRQLEIGDDSFWDFKSFELSNVNSLQSIYFGNSCFYYADFSLKGE